MGRSVGLQICTISLVLLVTAARSKSPSLACCLSSCIFSPLPPMWHLGHHSGSCTSCPSRTPQEGIRGRLSHPVSPCCATCSRFAPPSAPYLSSHTLHSTQTELLNSQCLCTALGTRPKLSPPVKKTCAVTAPRARPHQAPVLFWDQPGPLPLPGDCRGPSQESPAHLSLP